MADKTQEKKKGGIVKDAVALFLITVIAGCLLGLVNDVTKDKIEEANLKAKMDAYQAVFADATEFTENSEITAKVEDAKSGNGEFQKLTDEANQTDAYKEIPIESVIINEVLEAKDASGNLLGYVVSFTSKAGYGGDINMSLGVTTEGKITGFEVVSNSETAGLGANCANAEFKDQFAGIETASIMYSKSGAKEGADPAEIDALSGATITTKAVTKAVNGVLLFVRKCCLGM